MVTDPLSVLRSWPGQHVPGRRIVYNGEVTPEAHLPVSLERT
jgi:hypothetical protein